MKVLFALICVFSFSFSFHSYGQGGWDIGYIYIDSLNSSGIGKDVKLDFIGELNSDASALSFRGFISNEDTITLVVDEEEIELIEKRNIQVDWGFYDELYLECTGYSSNQLLRIYHTIIEEINENSVKCRLYIEISGKNRKGVIVNNPRRRCESVWINRSQLSGMIIKK